MKLYNSNKCNSFEMMFGFKQPSHYKIINRNKDRRTKEYGNQRKYENNKNKIVRSKESI